MKVGLVGVGRWGMTLARKLKELGHEIPFYDRLQSNVPVEGLGERLQWTVMRKEVDAMVIAATPPITSDVALVCAMNGIPVLATKPLLHADEILVKRKQAPFTVDFVHLHSPIMMALYDLVDGLKKRRVYVDKVSSQFYGGGPVRPLTSLYDYGPHAISAILELTASKDISVHKAKMDVKGVEKDREIWTATGFADDVEVEIIAGNGADEERCRLDVTFSDGSQARYEETYPKAYLTVNGKTVERTEAHDPLKALLQEFSDHVATKTSAMTEAAAQADLTMCVDVMEAIRKIRKAADDSQ